MARLFVQTTQLHFHLEKKGQYLWPGNEYCGKVHVVSMGITQESWLDHKPHTAVLEPEDLKNFPPVWHIPIKVRMGSC